MPILPRRRTVGVPGRLPRAGKPFGTPVVSQVRSPKAMTQPWSRRRGRYIGARRAAVGVGFTAYHHGRA